MNKQIIDAIPGIIYKLGKINIADIGAFLGFDACIDNIVRIVRDKKGNDVTGYFSDSNQFGEFLINLHDKSCGVELQTKLSKIGGNMVITGNALGNLGIKGRMCRNFWPSGNITSFPDNVPKLFTPYHRGYHFSYISRI